MTNSTITRDELNEVIATYGKHHIAHRMAIVLLAAMDSEPVAWTDEEELRDVNVAGIGYLFGIDREANKFADPRRQIMLYRHAQQPVVPETVLVDLEYQANHITAWHHMDEHSCKVNRRDLLTLVNACLAAMLQEHQKSAGDAGDVQISRGCRSSENVQVLHTIKSPPAMGSLSKTGEVLHANSPAIQEGYVMVPKEPTEEMINAWLSEVANWRGHVAGYKAMLAAAPQSFGSEPATVPGKWIPVSERMPERGDWLVTDGCDFDVQLFNGEQFIPGFVWEDKITHWMPLPAAPQEVKGE
jgi:hypothetical protein